MTQNGDIGDCVDGLAWLSRTHFVLGIDMIYFYFISLQCLRLYVYNCLRTYYVIPESYEWHNAIYPFITMPTCLFTAYFSTLCAHLQYKVWQCDAKPVASAIKDLY